MHATCLYYESCTWLIGLADVDDAVSALAKDNDPTGGRGANGNITKQLEANREVKKDVLGSAV